MSRFNLGAFWQLLYNAVRYEQEARILGVSIPTNQGPKKHDGTALVSAFPLIFFGELTLSNGKSPFFMGKST